MKFGPRLLTATASAGFFLACALVPTGCGKRTLTLPPPSAEGISGGNWGIPLKEWKPEAGLDEAQAAFVTWGDPGAPPGSSRGLACVILTDVVGSEGVGFHTGGISGHHFANDGRTVLWLCETTDGKTGIVTINDQKHDLAQGSLFLVSTRGGELRVLQLKRDTLKLKAEDVPKESLETLIRSDEEIGPFFAKAGKSKKAP
jgi:hypothetical protein